MSEATTVNRDPVAVTTAEALAEPFEPTEIKFKPQMVKNNRCLAMAYIDARLIQDRLDDVLGVENWEDGYRILPDGSVMCRLKVKLGERWITKTDVGSPSEQPDGGDRLKAAFSDALKRAGVKLGIGRYLYELPKQWCDFDPAKKCFTQTPQLPGKFLPKKKPAAPQSAAKQQPPAASTPAPSKGPSLYDELADYLNAAGSVQELARVWDSCGAAKKDGHVTADEYAELGAIKNRSKERLGMPAGK